MNVSSPAPQHRAPELLTYGLIEELYRRRRAIRFGVVMALVLAATAVGLRVWSPDQQAQTGRRAADPTPASESASITDQTGPVGTWQLWTTPENASGARVWAVVSPSSTTTTTPVGGTP